jgi:hypothetical protein
LRDCLDGIDKLGIHADLLQNIRELPFRGVISEDHIRKALLLGALEALLPLVHLFCYADGSGGHAL